MKKLVISVFLALASQQLFAASSYLGTDNQDVTVTNVTTTTISGSVNVISTGITVNGTVNVGNTLNVVSTNTVVSGNVNASITNVATVTVSGSVTTSFVAGSSVALKGASGNNLTSETLGGTTEALHVRSVNSPNLFNKFMVYTSSNNVVVAGTVTRTGLIKSVDLMAITGSCTYSINSGESIIVNKNTSETFDYAYTLSNASVNLSAKDSAATCKVRIVGAN